ncbi:Integral membrane protein (PIN domain superfamily) [Legionella beliardensis]|uniref:Integral membrane protein (PIN domain superfamily) n=1 Tax=Legionella beliardensis TaxID=91822 RepID=A0A378I254_9GAMM|nr:hypothetical protein [Legionella beliardensis]STX29258.1 Integral membrane protein (PIN domain superfamily) [Legionella beliardensis]
MIPTPLHSFLIEQVLGLYLIIMAIVMIARADYYRNVLKDLTANRALVMVSASLTLVLGLIMVVIHNIWEVRFGLIITLVAWLILIKAVLWLAVPEFMANLIKRFSIGSLYVTAAIAGIIGILLLTHAYHVFG